MIKFVSISSRINWAADAVCVESLFDLIDARQRRLGDQPDFLQQLIREARLSVAAILDGLSVDDFAMFADLVAFVVAEWIATPHQKWRFTYEVSVLIVMLSRDPRSENAIHDPILHRITHETAYGVPLWASRFIWTNVVAALRESNVTPSADTVFQALNHIETGFDLVTMAHDLLGDVESALRSLKALQASQDGYSRALRLRECDVYIDDLIMLVGGLRATL
jgi:hypothetical protein